MSSSGQAANRRKFLQFLAASPLFAAGGAAAFAETILPKSMVTDPLTWGPRQSDNLIKSPKDAINVFDFEPVMRQNVPPAHFGYMASGIDDEVTLRRNREDFLKFQLRPRRLVDVSKVDMSVDILGVKYDSPIVLAPVGGQRSFHDDGELAAARAAVTSSTELEATVDRICRWLPALAPRAEATSPSAWNARWPPTGASTIGES